MDCATRATVCSGRISGAFVSLRTIICRIGGFPMEVLGVSMVGNSAGEVIHEAAMALRFRAKINDFIELLHVYPTMAEALKIIAISRRKDPAKLSCCAFVRTINCVRVRQSLHSLVCLCMSYSWCRVGE